MTFSGLLPDGGMFSAKIYYSINIGMDSMKIRRRLIGQLHSPKKVKPNKRNGFYLKQTINGQD
jgi:hypothetical protein